MRHDGEPGLGVLDDAQGVIVAEAMSDAEHRGLITVGARTAKWATIRRDGRPHVVPVWLVLEGDDLVITTGSRSVKGRAVLCDPRVGLCIDDVRRPTRSS